MIWRGRRGLHAGLLMLPVLLFAFEGEASIRQPPVPFLAVRLVNRSRTW